MAVPYEQDDGTDDVSAARPSGSGPGGLPVSGRQVVGSVTRPHAIVVGARNLGGAILDKLLADGWTVTGVARSDETLAAVTARGATALAVDATDPEAVENVLRGVPRVDLAVNATASYGGPGAFGGGPISEADLGAFEDWAAKPARQAFAFLSVRLRATASTAVRAAPSVTRRIPAVARGARIRPRAQTDTARTGGVATETARHGPAIVPGADNGFPVRQQPRCIESLDAITKPLRRRTSTGPATTRAAGDMPGVAKTRGLHLGRPVHATFAHHSAEIAERVIDHLALAVDEELRGVALLELLQTMRPRDELVQHQSRDRDVRSVLVAEGRWRHRRSQPHISSGRRTAPCCLGASDPDQRGQWQAVGRASP